MIIYLARNRANGKSYVGKTKRSLAQRVTEHARAADKGSPQLFHRAIRKHSVEAFEWQVIVELLDDDITEQGAEAALDMYERKMIALYASFGPAGYNLTEGGDGAKGLVHSTETRAKMSEARKGEKNHNYGKSWGRKGPWSEETKQKMREAALGRKHSEEVRKKIGVAQYVAVEQLDMAGNHVATYGSMVEAEQATGVGRTGISRCCRFPHRSAAGFRFRYLSSEKGSR